MKVIWHALLVILSPAVLSQISKPHIITVFIDDVGWNDVSYHGSNQIQTPNIDALAYSGMIFHRHYVLPTCTPSRTALLTGTYPIRTGMQGFPLKAGENRNVPLSFKLKPAWLRDLGYKTHMVGKWHLGFETFANAPNHRGFDSFFGYYTGYIDYYKYDQNQSVGFEVFGDEIYRGYDLHYNDHVFKLNKSVYATRLFTERAQEVIREHNTSEPLYLYVAHLAGHTGSDDTEMQVPEDSDVNKTYSYIKDYPRRALAGCLEDLDKSVGVIMEELRNKNMLENSIILLMADNGGHTVSVDMPPNWSSNWPLAGTKFTLYEGGVRGLALIWSPLLPKGFINYGFLHISDWLPTLYSAAGGDPKDLGEIDGIDQWKALQDLTTVRRDNILLNINEKIGAEAIIMNNRWKLIKAGFNDYANYEHHWGKEVNVAPNPDYEPNNIINSPTGRIIQTLQKYRDILKPKRILELRNKVKVSCDVPEHNIFSRNGYVNPSSDFRCPDYCIFDLINDPCELQPVSPNEVKDIANTMKRFLQEYKKKLVPQNITWVDEMSNPDNFAGVWMPWKIETCARSTVGEFTRQYLSVSLFITMSWYSLKKLYKLSM